MKITVIEKACKAKREILRLEAVNDEGDWRGTYVGTGGAVFALDDDFPDLTPMEYLQVFGVPDKETEKWHIGSGTSTNPVYAGNFPGEIPAFERPLKVANTVGAWWVFRTQKGERLFVPAEYLEPFKKLENVFFFLREHEGIEYLAVKAGFQLEAVIAVPKEDDPEIKELWRVIRSVFLEEGAEKNE
ncbi:MAG: hypothetical protein IJ306_02510 [Oscillospiraceae bacterium]|nr:hypothetical protein [Oscillospiraceae bacterium]